jgi:hypothetical protein
VILETVSVSERKAKSQTPKPGIPKKSQTDKSLGKLVISALVLPFEIWDLGFLRLGFRRYLNAAMPAVKRASCFATSMNARVARRFLQTPAFQKAG